MELEKSTKYIIIVFLVLFVLLVGFILLRYYYESKSVIKYKGVYGEYRIDIVDYGGINMYEVYVPVEYSDGTKRLFIHPLRYSPYDVEGVYLEKNVEGVLNRPKGIKVLYVTQDLELGNKTNQTSFVALLEFGKILSSQEYGIYGLDVKSAFTSASEKSKQLEIPIIKCEDASENIAVIYLKLGDENKVYSNENCLIVQGEDEMGLLKAADKFAYHLMGVF